jgi:hypothetical protein
MQNSDSFIPCPVCDSIFFCGSPAHNRAAYEAHLKYCTKTKKKIDWKKLADRRKKHGFDQEPEIR